MVGKGKAPIIILIILIILSLCLAGVLVFLLQKEQAKGLVLQQKLEEAQQLQKQTETQLQQFKREATNLELNLKDAQSRITALDSQLRQEIAAKEEAQTRIAQLTTDIDAQKTLSSDLETKLKQAQEDLKEAQGQAESLASEKAALEKKIKDLEEKSKGVELGTIVVNPEGVPSSNTDPVAGPQKGKEAETLEGKVMVVNKDYGFVVINLGANDGVAIGETLQVYRNNKYIGDIKIEKVHDAMSAAGFLSDDIKDKISEQDRVVRKPK